MRPLFQLGPRLALCAQLVREGSRLCDVGTDHAYLPIWLLKTGKISQALAADVNPGPLDAARRDGEKYGVDGGLSFRLSDGLRQIRPEEAQDVVIAGMGGELMLRIISETPWLRDPEKQLVLQPMSSVAELRQGLWQLGFQVLREEAVVDAGKVYSAFSARYTETSQERDPLFLFMGKLRPGAPAVDRYAQKMLRMLASQRKGALHRGEGERVKELDVLMENLRKRYLPQV